MRALAAEASAKTGFAHRSAAKVGVRVQVLAGFVMGAGFCKNHDKPINHTVRVMLRRVFFSRKLNINPGEDICFIK